MVATQPKPVEHLLGVFEARGGNLELMHARDEEILIEGPAGTGKTRACLELLHLLCKSYDGLRCLIVRKVGKTLATSCLITFNEEVLHVREGVKFYHGSLKDPAAYVYPNGSTIVLGGMDEAGKVLSTQYDVIYANECYQLTLDDWENLTGRLRHGRLPHMRIIGDTNPAPMTHWLYKREADGKIRVIVSKHQDNPAYFDEQGEPTAAGQRYIARLGNMTGTRRQRLLLGQRVGVENAIYGNFDREIHVRKLEPGLEFQTGALGADYGRIHRAAAVVVQVDQYGRRWVRAAWGEPDTEQGGMTAAAASRLKGLFSVGRVRTDPTQDVLAGKIGGQIAKGSPGARIARTRMVARLMRIFPGGQVPREQDEIYGNVVQGPWPLGSDTPGFFIEEGCEGCEELVGQIQGYHYRVIETEGETGRRVALVDDDLVAALEYAIEELEHEGAVSPYAGVITLGESRNPDARPAFKSWPSQQAPWERAPATARNGAAVKSTGRRAS